MNNGIVDVFIFYPLSNCLSAGRDSSAVFFFTVIYSLQILTVSNFCRLPPYPHADERVENNTSKCEESCDRRDDPVPHCGHAVLSKNKIKRHGPDDGEDYEIHSCGLTVKPCGIAPALKFRSRLPCFFEDQ